MTKIVTGTTALAAAALMVGLALPAAAQNMGRATYENQSPWNSLRDTRPFIPLTNAAGVPPGGDRYDAPSINEPMSNHTYRRNPVAEGEGLGGGGNELGEPYGDSTRSQQERIGHAYTGTPRNYYYNNMMRYGYQPGMAHYPTGALAYPARPYDLSPTSAYPTTPYPLATRPHNLHPSSPYSPVTPYGVRPAGTSSLTPYSTVHPMYRDAYHRTPHGAWVR